MRFRSALITGGAGFIGSHLTAALRVVSEQVTVFDSLHPQVHGEQAEVPINALSYNFVLGDIRDRAAINSCVGACRPDIVVHLASETGTGQSFDHISHYCDVNVQGTAYLAEALRSSMGDDKYRVILASSRAIYGEGAYHNRDGDVVIPPPRLANALAAGRFDPSDIHGRLLVPVATPEDVPLRPASIYASTKLMQEYILTQALAGTNASIAILRLQNVYGPGQSLHNAYTGVLSIFAKKIRDGILPLEIYEDGEIGRDFVYIDDVVEAFMLAANMAEVPPLPINIGTSDRVTMLRVAHLLLVGFGERPDAYTVSGRFRMGDVRHARADIARAQELLRWTPRTGIDTGIAKVVAWVAAGSPPIIGN